MADQQKIDNQDAFNKFLERELELRQENQAFLGETLSIGAQIADQIEHQLGKIGQRLTLDKEILKSSKDSVNVVKRLSSNYSSINDVQKDQIKIQKQVQTNLNVIAAKSKFINEEDLKAARAYIEKEKALEKQQKLTADLLAQQEKMEAEFRAQEDAGKSLTQDQINRRIVMEANIKASQTATAEMTKQQIAASKMINEEAVSVELLKDQNEELNKANAYLEEQENRLKGIEKAQGLFNISLGFAEGFLNKIGANSAVVSLGLEEGRAAAEQMAKELSEGGTKSVGLFGQMQILFAGIGGTIGGMAKGLKEALTLVGALTLVSKTLGKALGALVNPILDFGKEIKGQISAGFDFLKKKFFSIGSFIDSFQVGEQLFFQISKDVADTATSLGVGTKEAQGLFNQAKKVNREIGMLPEEVMKLTAGLNESFGSTQKFSDDTVKTVGQLVNLYGLSNQEAAEFAKLAELSGETTADTVLQYKSEIQALKARNNIALSEKEVMKEIAGISAATQLTLRGQGKSLADAAFQAKKMGLEMSKLEGMSSNLLNFEDSIAKEMEAELLIGRDLQLDKARQLALQGDLAGVAEEVASQIGSASEFGKMNVMQQQALADSVGLTRDELAKTLKTQELLANTGFKDMSSAQQEFNKLLKETGSEEKAIAALKKKGASQALTDQLRGVSAQEKEAQRQRDLVDAQYEMAMAMRPVAEGFRSILQTVEDLRKIIIEQMKPFFSRFGGDVGDAGDKFGKLLEGPAKSFGIFLNDVGIKMLDAVESIDLDKLIQDGKDFIDSIMAGIESVKTFFTESPLGALFGGSTALAGVGTAAVALGKGLAERGSRMKPMYVKQADTGLFDMLKPGKTKPASLLKQAKTLIKKPQVMARALGMKGGIGGKLGGKALGGLAKIGAKGLLKAIPGVGLIATAGMALFDAAKAAKNAGEIFDKKPGEKVTTGERVAAGIGGALSSLTFGLLDPKTTAQSIKKVGDAMGKGLGKAFDFVKERGGKATSFIFDKFKTQIGNIKDLFVGVFTSIWDYIKGTFNNVKELVSNTFAGFKDLFGSLFSGDLGGAFDALKGILGGLGTFFSNQFKTAVEGVKGIFGSAFSYIADSFRNIFGGIGDKIIEYLKMPINGMIGMMNSLITKINEALTFTIDIPGFGEQGIKTEIPSIPALAEGGIVDKATVALIGEAGPEAVVPLDEFTQSNEKTQQEIRELKEIMGTFVQQMAQVVNQPMVIELDGNKVGEAMGRSSFRVQ
jgi:hypothetical protein